MATPKTFDVTFVLNAQMGAGYSKTFQAAQQQLTAVQQELRALSKAQADLTAYQKQEAAIKNTGAKLEVLRQQYDNIQKEIQQTGTFSSALENRLLSKQLQIDKTADALRRQEERLETLGGALKEAGVDMDGLGRSSAQLSNRIEALKQEQAQAAEAAQNFGGKAGQAISAVHEAIAAAGIAAALREIYRGFAACAQASMDFESAMTGVAKTTDLTDEELAAMSAAVQRMSTEIPAAAEESAAGAEAAGQLGIQKDALLDFTEVMTMLGTATNMTADEAATALARFANITGTPAGDYDRLGSVIVALGNRFATTESEITEMATRLASAGTLAGLSEAEILALSAAMSSVGIEAEAGGTAMTETLNAIETAAAQGGGALAEFARIAGMSSEEFASAWETDAMSALGGFISGLGQLEARGENTVLVLEDLGLTGIRQSNMLKSLALAAGQMNGAVRLANEEWETNTALLTEASKRYATTQSQLTMMQNAYQNLKAAIGDAYNPALKEAYAIGTDVLSVGARFVQQNPELVNAVTAFAGVMGLAAGGLTAYTVAVKAASAASSIFATVSAVSLGPILGAAAAAAAVTAAVAALATAAANDAVPSVSELTEAAQGMREAMEESNAAFEAAAGQTAATAEVAGQYISRLEELGDYARLADAEQEEYRNTLTLLCQLMPELSSLIDVQTGSIEGGTAALRAQTAAWRENAEAQAYQEYLNQLAEQYNAVMVESVENSVALTRAQRQLEAAEEARAAVRARMRELERESTENKTRLPLEYWDLQSELERLTGEVLAGRDTVNAYTRAIEADEEAVAAAKEEMELAKEAMDGLNTAAAAGAEVTEETAAQLQTLQSAAAGVKEEMDALAAAYAEAYSAALESISGQYQLWDEAAGVAATSAGSINSALESQIAYWQSYNANLQALTGRSADIEGLSEMIASFADGSQDSVNAIAGMAGATDEQLAEMAANWRTLQEEQKQAAGSVADLKTGFTADMDELQTELAEDIENMDLGEEAAESGRATIQGYLSGAEGMLPRVAAAYARIADAAQRALTARTGGPSLPGYASGTRSAKPGFAVVGENGPEVVYFHGGEQVMTAAETAALRERASLEAVGFAPALMAYLGAYRADSAGPAPVPMSGLKDLPAGPAPAQAQAAYLEAYQADNAGSAPALTAYANAYRADSASPALSAERGWDGGGGSVVIHFAPRYDLSGAANAAELEAVLAAHDEEMREMILEVLQEAGVDAARRAYK